MNAALSRHAERDWGEVHPALRAANDFALLNRDRLLSGYYNRDGVRFWIVTEADRRTTTILMPDGY